MVRGKRVRDKGKIKFSEYFKDVPEGKRVSIVRELAVEANFPKRIQGKVGVVKGSRGSHKLVEVKEGRKLKTFIIHPVHLKEV